MVTRRTLFGLALVPLAPAQVTTSRCDVFNRPEWQYVRAKQLGRLHADRTFRTMQEALDAAYAEPNPLGLDRTYYVSPGVHHRSTA